MGWVDGDDLYLDPESAFAEAQRLARDQGRASGSINIVAACRSILLFGADPEDFHTRAMIHIKSNLSSIGAALGYTLKSGAFRWTGESTLTADRVFANSRSGGIAALEEAERFLLETLAGGAQPVTEVQKEAAARGISRATLGRAMKAVKVIPERVMDEGVAGVKYWTWRLPDGPPAESPEEDSPFDEYGRV